MLAGRPFFHQETLVTSGDKRRCNVDNVICHSKHARRRISGTPRRALCRLDRRRLESEKCEFEIRGAARAERRGGRQGIVAGDALLYKTATRALLCETISHSSRSGCPPRTQAAQDLVTICRARASPADPPEMTANAVYFSMMRDFLRSAPTVSVGCAPFASHALMAGALRFDCFLIGSYHPSSCW